jgi:glutathione S-transferase
MYILHYAPDNASMIIRLVLQEAALPYRVALVDRSTRAQDSAAYRRLNPAGLIPALETPDGPLFETGAILLWLADRHTLGPNSTAPNRGDFLKWLFFISNTAHADLRQLFYPDQYVPKAATPGHHAIISARMKRHFTLLNQAAADHPDLFTPPSILSAYLAPLMRWAVLYPQNQTPWFHLPDYPHLAELAKSLETRPAALQIATAEGLGNTPFSAPTYAKPPEGSAL